MTNPKILVTGATGRTGGAVVTQLLAKGRPVRAAVRIPDARSDRLQSLGAEVGVAAFPDPARHGGKSCRPIGPKLLTVIEMAGIIGRVVGHNVRHVKSPLWMFYKGAKSLGAEPFLLSGLRYWGEDNDRGAFAVGAPNDTVRELTGKEAEDFETIARRHAALPPSRQNFRTRLAVLARFMMLPMLPGFDPVAYERP